MINLIGRRADMINLIGRRTDNNGILHTDVEAFLVMRADQPTVDACRTALLEGRVDDARAVLEHIGDDRLFDFIQAHPLEVRILPPVVAASE